MWIAETIDDVRERCGNFDGVVGLVPTMGALHDGHLALIKHAHELADHVLVSIFVNPTQFNASADLSAYPRPIEADLKACRKAGVHGVFQPSVEEVYPPGVPAVEVTVPEVARQLEGEHRPGHFEGVCRVVAKLFNIMQPDFACFGEKDMQQLLVIEAMVDDLFMPVSIEPCPTVREKDGLAMSSRNRLLDDAARKRALGLYMALSEAKAQIEAGVAGSGAEGVAAIETSMLDIMRSHSIEPDYAVLREPLALQPVETLDDMDEDGVIALAAGTVKVEGGGSVRLIDNMVIGVGD